MARRMTAQQREARQHLIAARELVKNPYRGKIQEALDLIEGRLDTGLTNLHYDRLEPGGKLMDPKHPGLLLRNGKRNGKRWFFRTTRPLTTTQVEIPIGDYPAVTIEEARRIREAMAAQRARGEMPAVPAGHGVSAETKTVADLCAWYLEEYCTTKRQSTVADDTHTINRHILPKFGATPIGEWSPTAISAHIQQLFNATGKGRQAEKTRALISSMNNAARGQSRRYAGRWWKSAEHPEDGGWLDDIPNPMPLVDQLPDRRRLEGKRPENHRPGLSEMRAYATNLPKLPQIYADALTLQLLSCARIGEIVGLPWSEISLEDGTWTLPASRAKNGDTHLVPLPAQALELLQRRREADPESLHVFPSPVYSASPVSKYHVIDILSRHRAELGVSERFTSHSVRHGMLTWCGENGIGAEIRDRVSNHRPPARIDAIYNGADLTPQAKAALQRWADTLLPRGGKVVQLGEVRA